MLAVYVDESADKEELQQIVAAAERLGVPVESAPNLERRLSLELSERVVENVKRVDDSGVGVALQRRSSSRKVLTTLATAAQEPLVARAAGYPFMLVLALADRNMNTALTHDHIAGIDFARIRMILTDLGRALDNLHSENRIHADFKPLNAARESTWKLIDMDVSCKFGEFFGTKLPSSGYCPPEMAKVLLAATDAKTGVVDTNEVVKYSASVAYDLWSFGVVLFHLCFGRPLWLMDQNDNVSLPDLKALANWTAAILNRKIKEANKPPTPDFNAAADLIKKLLVPDAEKRCKPFEEGCEMSSVLEHPFFQVGGELTVELKQQLDRIEKEQLKQTEEQLKQTAMLTAIDTRTKEIKLLQRATIQLLNEHASSLRACIQAR